MPRSTAACNRHGIRQSVTEEGLMAENTEKSEPIARLRRHVIVVADEAEREAMAKRGKRATPKGIDELVILTPLEAVTRRGLPVDSFEITDAAEAADYFSDAKAALESDQARTTAGTI